MNIKAGLFHLLGLSKDRHNAFQTETGTDSIARSTRAEPADSFVPIDLLPNDADHNVSGTDIEWYTASAEQIASPDIAGVTMLYGSTDWPEEPSGKSGKMGKSTLLPKSSKSVDGITMMYGSTDWPEEPPSGKSGKMGKSFLPKSSKSASALNYGIQGELFFPVDQAGVLGPVGGVEAYASDSEPVSTTDADGAFQPEVVNFDEINAFSFNLADDNFDEINAFSLSLADHAFSLNLVEDSSHRRLAEVEHGVASSTSTISVISASAILIASFAVQVVLMH
jgi:hypothetical protein